MTVNNRYHLDEGKVVWAYKDGELTQLDPYTDDNYHLVVSVGTFLSFSPIATFLPKSAPGLHPFIATVSMLD
jgi:hypothetical protein